MPNHHIASLLHHSQEICGLDWSPDGNLLASGGNDDTLNIWDVNLQSSGEITEALHSLEHHVAAVKVGLQFELTSQSTKKKLMKLNKGDSTNFKLKPYATI